MSETSKIALMAMKLSDEVFSEFFWTKVGPEDQNWPCEDKVLHGVDTHPADVVWRPFEDWPARRAPFRRTTSTSGSMARSSPLNSCR